VKNEANVQKVEERLAKERGRPAEGGGEARTEGHKVEQLGEMGTAKRGKKFARSDFFFGAELDREPQHDASEDGARQRREEGHSDGEGCGARIGRRRF